VAKCSPGESSSRKIATATASDDKVRIDLDGQTAIIVPRHHQLGDQPFQTQYSRLQRVGAAIMNANN
jgi:hypothetical protein